MSGFIKIHRKLKEWEWYSDTNVFRLFMHLLLNANYKDKQWRGITIKRGQLVVGIKSFGLQIGLTWQETRTAINKLKRTGELTTKATNKNTLVTLVNFEFYQGSQSESNNQSNKQITNNQQAINNNIRKKRI